MLVFIKRVVQKGLNGVGKEKKSFMQKVVQKRACLDCGLDFLHTMLDVILIVCLVVFAIA
jgi:hypothetical protein